MKPNWKTIGILTTIAGGILTVLSNIADDRKMEETIEEKLNEKLAERENEEESE